MTQVFKHIILLESDTHLKAIERAIRDRISLAEYRASANAAIEADILKSIEAKNTADHQIGIILVFDKADDLAIGLVSVAQDLASPQCPHQRELSEYKAYHAIDTIRQELGDRITEREIHKKEPAIES